MKHASDLHSIILVAMHVQCNAKMIGSIAWHIEHALDHFGRIHEPKEQDAIVRMV